MNIMENVRYENDYPGKMSIIFGGCYFKQKKTSYKLSSLKRTAISGGH